MFKFYKFLIILIVVFFLFGALEVKADNPTPAIDSISPNGATLGDPDFTLTINGTDFILESVIQIGQMAMATNFISNTQVTTFISSVPPQSFPPQGPNYITVVNPGPGGGTSNAQILTITAPPPNAITLSVSDTSCPILPQTTWARFSWKGVSSVGNRLGRFQIQIDNNSTFTSPEVNRTFNGSWPNGVLRNQTVYVNLQYEPDSIAYNTTFYWRVMEWDISPATGQLTGKNSGWVYPGGLAPGTPYSTILRPGPYASFTFSPSNPAPQSLVAFADTSICYGSVNALQVNLNYTPTSIKVSPLGNVVYAAGENTVEKRNISDLSLLGSFSPNGNNGISSLAVSSNGNDVYATAKNNSKLFKINTFSMTESLSVNTGSGSPASVILSPDGSFAYVLKQGSNKVLKYSTALALIATGNTSDNPVSLAISSDGQFLYVLNGNGIVEEINANTLAPVRSFSGQPNSNSIGITPDNNYLYLVSGNNPGIDKITKIRRSDFTFVSDALTDNSPRSVDILSDSSNAYWVNFFSNTVQKLNANLQAPALTSSTDNHPVALDISPDNLRLYVANESQTIQVFNASDLSKIITQVFIPGQIPCASRSWNFGDPASGAQNTSTAQNPSHTYVASGFYNVNLTATDDSALLCQTSRTVPVFNLGNTRGLPRWWDSSPYYFGYYNQPLPPLPPPNCSLEGSCTTNDQCCSGVCSLSRLCQPLP